VALEAPPPLSTNPIRRVVGELAAERRALGGLPPGDTAPSVARTRRMIRDPLGLLLDAYERHGPVFSVRILHANNVFVLGPEANHFALVSGAEHFRWRDGGFGDLIPLLGDGLLTIDGDFHRRSRRIMLPAFHRERIASYQATMEEEAQRGIARWRDGETIDVYHWSRGVALRVAMRALFGLDPDDKPDDLDPAREFERALAFYGEDYWLQVLRGPHTPFARLQSARERLDALIYAEIARRRRSGARGEDVLSLLLDAREAERSGDEGSARGSGEQLNDRQVRDQVMTLLFAGHDTTTSTVSFLLWEMAEQGGWDDDLEPAIDETLRLYPPAWIGPRRSVKPFALHGIHVPAGVPVNYCSWASHRLPDVWEEPNAFRPERFVPGEREKIPRGAYIPFGGGSRICLGMRFGQLEIRVIAAAIRERFRLERVPGHRLEIRQTPTLGPKAGLPMVIRAR
jgi:cytochrome P450